MNKGKVILICGLPGSGKTTLAKKLEAEREAIRFCPDEWMIQMGVSLWSSDVREVIEQRFWHLAQRLASLGVTSILENGFWTREERDSYLSVAREKGFQIELIPLFVSKEETLIRLGSRGMEGDDTIVKEKLDEYFDAFEMPADEELAQYDS